MAIGTFKYICNGYTEFFRGNAWLSSSFNVGKFPGGPCNKLVPYFEGLYYCRLKQAMIMARLPSWQS